MELLANRLVQMDVDGDGLVEAGQSGNYGTLVAPGRSSNWYDAINFGYKDAYANAITYRAWKCLADLENKLGNQSMHATTTLPIIFEVSMRTSSLTLQTAGLPAGRAQTERSMIMRVPW